MLPDAGENVVLFPETPTTRERAQTLVARVVEVPTGRLRFTFDHRLSASVYDPGLAVFEEEIERVMIARPACRFGDGLLVRDGRGYIRWDWTTGRRLDEFTTSSSGFTTAPDGRRLPTFGDYAATPDGGRLVIASGRRMHVSDSDLTTLTRRATFAAPPVVHFRADGRLECLDESPGPRPNQLSVWDVRNGALLESVFIHGSPSGSSWHHDLPSARLVAYRGKDGGFFVYDRVADRRISRLDVKGGDATYPILSQDGRRVLLSGYSEQSQLVRWYDAATGSELGRFQIRKGAITDDAGREYDHEWFADDGSVFGFLTWDFRLTLVDCATGKARTIGVSRLFSGRQRWHYKSVGADRMILAYSADFSDRPRGQPAEFELWDREGNLLRRFKALVSSESEGGTLVVSPDGRTLHAPSTDHAQIEFFETATGRKRGHIPCAHVSSFPAFSPDGTLIAAGSPDCIVLLWDAARLLGSRPDLPPPADANAAEALWQTLGGPDPIEADPAVRALARAPEQALAIVKQSWTAPDGKAGGSRSTLRDVRALEVLERIGTPAAKELVESVAGGAANSRRTHEAKLILARWPAPAH